VAQYMSRAGPPHSTYTDIKSLDTQVQLLGFRLARSLARSVFQPLRCAFLSRSVLDSAMEVIVEEGKAAGYKGRAATLVLLAVLVCRIHIKADIWPLVLTGDAIPGTANFRFVGFSGQSVINTSGTVAFKASFVDPATGLTGRGIFKKSEDKWYR
jgi:hypothetical protein